MIVVAPVYAGILALLFAVLTIRVIGRRRAARVSLGDGGDVKLLRRQRAHANFAEYVPLALVLMLCAELQQAPLWLLNLMGICLVAGRILHAYAVSREPEPMKLRVAGMALTITALLIGAIGNVSLAAPQLLLQ